jgi:predicted nucleic acid-binding protein
MPIRRILDANILIYALNQSHPAYSDCVEYLHKYDEPDIFISIYEVLYEIYHGLTVYYGIPPETVINKLDELIESNIGWRNMTLEEIQKGFHDAVSNKLDITDCRLLIIAESVQAPIIVTDDKRLGNYIEKAGLIWETPISPTTRKKIEEWEKIYCPPKGLPRVLSHVHKYIQNHNSKLAEQLKSDTENLTKLPN